VEALQFLSRAIPAYVALARRDTASAIRLFAGLTREGTASLERLTEGVLLARGGRDAEAIRVLDRAFPLGWASPLKVLARLETGRAADRLGQRDRALADYQHVLDAWRHADPELQPYVSEARTAISRLSAERS
jgi:hypothetical protein